ncbi:heavy metal translocating P-type ATPase [Anaeromassilibacillus senegalensis]|uniref:Cd(2+)-exporting ATPase n=1 Tax=Anaeromassilibacillus senegalensis TaxID=1673717 RepID=A0ABS9CPH8_9FIRM|nr:heavy metal translocating P-type ATPase [Anaeromassilibacillus senegalensis]MCF2652276.1 cadmium-translocating P-type ATPase [Anaeromassilibacillus senegalensis]
MAKENKTCACCAHEHEEHEHHDHHGHRQACCEHEHHDHNHDHKDGCACGHDHDHDHEGGCACGHDHHHDEEAPKWVLPVAVALFAVGLIFEHVLHLPIWAAAVVHGLAAVLAGYDVFLDGVKNLVKLNFTENVLMSIAIVTAFCLGEFGEAAAVAILFNIGEMAEEIAEHRSRRSIAALTEMRPDTARVLREGAEQTVSPSEVAVGETVVVHPFERIPLDGVITTGSSYIDNAALTGESVPVEVAPGDSVLSGGVNGSAKLTLEVMSAFEDSTASRILRMIEESSARKGSAEKLITRFARVYTPIVLVLAVLVAVLPPLFGLGVFQIWLYRALVMLVASCPCALVISVPLGFFAGIGVESANGMLVKGGKYLEALAKTETVVLDKTGTITTGTLSVSEIWTVDGVSEQALLKLAASAEALSTHPVAKAIREAAGEAPQADEINEIAGRGIRAVIGGKTVFAGRRSFLAENGVDVSNLPECTVAIAADGRAVGAITLTDTVKPDSKEAVAALRASGVEHVVMLTGDNEAAAKAVSAQVGITEYRAGLLPQDKASEVEKMQGVRVFVGDGVNDAPVLAASDCGVAIGLGSQAAIETADAVLSGGNLSLLPRAIRLARRCMRVIRFNIGFALAVKAAVIFCTPFGFVPMWVGVFADVGVTALTVLNTLRILKFKAK